MRFIQATILIMLLTAPLLPLATAQDEARPNLVLIDLEVPEVAIETPIGQMAIFTMTVKDTSLDDPSRVGAPPLSRFPHRNTFDITIEGAPSGWLLDVPAPFDSFAGTEQTIQLGVRPTTALTQRVVTINFTITATGDFGEDSRSALLEVSTPGLNSLSAVAASLGDPLQPREIRDGFVLVRNNALFPGVFRMEAEDAQGCGLTIVTSSDLAIPPKTSVEMPLTVQAPSDKLRYVSEDCPIKITVSNVNDPAIMATAQVGSTINGYYMDPVWVFWLLGIAVAIIVIVLVVARRKAAIEEEILGKPQRPWTIPVERVYLEHLEARDARAAYVVRHFLMEEEYKSALLWYKSYKAATKGTRSKETLVVSQEKVYKRFQKRWASKIAKPIKKADRYAVRLQRKLDRQAKATVRQDRRKWKKRIKKLEKRHEQKAEKLMASWEKAVRKADKRGEAAPAKPDVGAPELPEKPELQKVLLADHKWNKKAERRQKRMVRKQGNLEVRFEKKDARRLAKVRRKVHRIARKIDDPEFVSEHPLLAESA